MLNKSRTKHTVKDLRDAEKGLARCAREQIIAINEREKAKHKVAQATEALARQRAIVATLRKELDKPKPMCYSISSNRETRIIQPQATEDQTQAPP